MKTFSNLIQLSEASVITGTPVTVLQPSKIEGVVQEQGEGLTLLSGNVFTPSFDDIEATTGRRTQIIADEFPGNVSAKLNLFKRGSDGFWLADPSGRTSTLYYAGALWWPLAEVPYSATDYVIQEWNYIGEDTLEIRTTGDLFFNFTRFSGLSTQTPDLVTPISQNRQIADGIRTVFDSPNLEQANDVNFLVVIDGFIQRATESYISGPGFIQFSEAPPKDSVIDITYFYPVNTTTSDSDRDIECKSLSSSEGIRAQSVPAYNNNDSAIAGGLAPGQFYQVSGTNPRLLAIVF